ncbi:MAG TPA: PGPGW domain-containing protein [Azospirillum sp.]|nr:PGPGW domain-containing protein [Azospirillum sp.]
MHRRPTAKAAALSYDRIRQLVLIGMGWTIIVLGVLITPLPGPGGLPVMILGGILLLRNSADARRMFVRMKRRHPRLFSPVEKLRRRFRRR